MSRPDATAAGPPAPPDPPELPDAAPRPEPEAPWPWWTGPAGVAVAFAIVLVLGAVVVGLGAAFGASATDPPPGVLIVSIFLQTAIFVAVSFGAVRLVTGRQVRPAALGLRRTRPWVAVGLVAASYVAFIVLTGLWGQAIDSQAQDTLPERLGVDSSDVALAVVALLVCVGAPLGEELLFRGLLFRSLLRIGLWPAVVITGLVFGLAHISGSPIEFIVPLIVLGGGLCLLYRQTGSLWPCMGLHALNNSVAFGVGVGWSWQVPLLALGALSVFGLLFLAVDRGIAPRLRPLPA